MRPTLLLFLVACNAAGAQAPVDVDPPCASVEDGVWESNPWTSVDPTCGYLEYAGETTYRIAHDLGRVPRSVDLYVSFSAAGDSVAPPAGDMARIQEVSDTHIEVRNQTDAEFFLRVVAR
ncbi:MAG: hypothetical protein ACI9KE_002903 [Polyangiales bacterium]|jgi:hypothetical protein